MLVTREWHAQGERGAAGVHGALFRHALEALVEKLPHSMTDTPASGTTTTSARRGIRERLYAARWVLVATAVVLLVLVFLGRISIVEAGVALAIVLAAATVRLPPVVVAQPAARPASSNVPFAVDPQLGAVIGALPGPALLVNRRGSILVGNDAVVAALGPVRRGEPISFTVRAPEVIEALRAANDGLPRRVQFTERVPFERTFEANVVPIFFERASERPEKPDAFLITFDDLTQQYRLDRMRADFVANASHELRTPLASLSGFVETLQGSARSDPAARDRFLGIMVQQARRMSRLIDDLLSLSRVELNEHLHPQHVVDLVPIVGHVCDTLSPLAREREVELSINRTVDQLPILGERDELIRLFENLVENALKYGATGKRVEVTIATNASDEGGEAVVAIRDFGPGIAAQHLPRLTERFYRVDVETSRAEGGTGLGLAIVKHIVARHRGRLTIESELGQGATFTVRLPLSTSQIEVNQAKTGA